MAGTEIDETRDLIFRALSDSTRREILRITLTGEHSVTSLARRYPMSFAAVQKHVAVLERAGMITKRQHGREQLVSGELRAVRDIVALLDSYEQIWLGRIDRINTILHNDTQKGSR